MIFPLFQDLEKFSEFNLDICLIIDSKVLLAFLFETQIKKSDMVNVTTWIIENLFNNETIYNGKDDRLFLIFTAQLD